MSDLSMEQPRVHRDCNTFHDSGHPCPARVEATKESWNAVKDSGERRSWSTGSVRDVATGKGRYDLLPAYPIRRLAIHFENGARKYGDKNWEKGQPLSVYISSALRHGFCVSDGQQDEDHAAAAAWNWFAFMHTAEKVRLGELPAELDDIGWNKESFLAGIDSVGPPD
jgi:hypothetical protein